MEPRLPRSRSAYSRAINYTKRSCKKKKIHKAHHIFVMQIRNIKRAHLSAYVRHGAIRKPPGPFQVKFLDSLWIDNKQWLTWTHTGCPTVGFRTKHPHSIQFLSVISTVSFDPFSETLCLHSWGDFSPFCPPLLFPPKQTTLMRNSWRWWKGSKKKDFILSLQNSIDTLYRCCFPSEGAGALVCSAASATAGCVWSVWPQRGVQRPGCL